MLRSRRPLASLIMAIGLASFGCEGDGGSEGLVVQSRLLANNCTPPPTLSPFPSGLAILSESLGLATMVQLDPNGLVVYDLGGERPRTVAVEAIGLDSDGDGLDDADAIEPILGFPVYPLMGEIQAVDDTVALVSSSNYEQVLVANPQTGRLLEVEIEVPAAIPALRFPLLPAPGTRATRTGISTLACVYPSSATDSDGRPIGSDPACGAASPSFLTSLTAGKAVAGGHLFVAGSNLFRGSRYFPGTVLVFEWERVGDAVTVRPSVDTPLLFASGFNTTGVVRFETPGGRELVLVAVSGAIRSGSGLGNVLTEAFVDVIDPRVPRIVATIPLGFAGPSFDAPAVERGGRLAWLGASSQRQLYAVDLRPLEDPRLYMGNGPPVVLDGMTPGFDDARIFTADRPFVLPRRTDGRASAACEGLTDVTTNSAGTRAFASDFCDGTITQVAFDLSGSPAIPYSPDRFQLSGQDNAFAPNDAVGALRAPSLIAARPGIPGVDYTSPDVLTLLGQPDGQICALRIESQ